MKKLPLFTLIFLIMFNPGLFAGNFEDWAEDLADELRNKTLQNAYARRLLFPKKDRTPTVAWPQNEDSMVFANIHDSNDLWRGVFRISSISSAEIMNIPIAPGAFHFAALFHFNEDVILTNHNGERKKTRGLLMGTGPEKDFSVQGVIGMQLIQMRVYSIEFYESIARIDAKYRHKVNGEKVDIKMFFLAHAEETARLAAMTYLRVLKAEGSRFADNPFFQKYNVFGANCIASGIQNLARAVKPAYLKHFETLGKKDLRNLEPLTAGKLINWSRSWHQVSLQALGAIIGRSPDRQKFTELETFHKQLRSTNMMSLPWRAKPLIDWACR